MPSPQIERSRIHNKLPVAREGLPFIFAGVGASFLFFFLGLEAPALFFGAISVFVVFFFRDPERQVTAIEKAVLTPADGRILEIRDLDDCANPLEEPAIKVSIFMSLFNVHVNRIPVSGKVSSIRYHSGNFFSANLDKASEQNEQNKITLKTGEGRKIIIVQVAGLIARRIVCWVREGEEVQSGQRFGLIRFGSRLDVYLPRDSRILTRTHHKVRAGKTILGHLS